MQYIIEKFIDGEWYYEGKGDIKYVNRVIKCFARNCIVFRLTEVRT